VRGFSEQHAGFDFRIQVVLWGASWFDVRARPRCPRHSFVHLEEDAMVFGVLLMPWDESGARSSP
jgi:hypothetical protein